MTMGKLDLKHTINPHLCCVVTVFLFVVAYTCTVNPYRLYMLTKNTSTAPAWPDLSFLYNSSAPTVSDLKAGFHLLPSAEL